MACSRYKAALKEKNALKENNEASRKRKIASDDIALKRQKLNEEECILNLILNKEIDQKSLEAEEKQRPHLAGNGKLLPSEPENKGRKSISVKRYHPEDGG